MVLYQPKIAARKQQIDLKVRSVVHSLTQLIPRWQHVLYANIIMFTKYSQDKRQKETIFVRLRVQQRMLKTPRET
jgi:hypothetical protein